jgi:hypothetical protein
MDACTTDVSQYCIEKVIEVCAVQIKIGNHLITLLCIYRSPSGDFGEFAVQFDLILKYLQKPKFEFMCGDFNLNFFIDSSSVQQLRLLLQSYKLFHIIDFPTRMTKDSSSAIDNIFFFYYRRINSFQVF